MQSSHHPEPASNGSILEDCTGGLVIQLFDDSEQVLADVVLPHGRITVKMSVLPLAVKFGSVLHPQFFHNPISLLAVVFVQTIFYFLWHVPPT